MRRREQRHLLYLQVGEGDGDERDDRQQKRERKAPEARAEPCHGRWWQLLRGLWVGLGYLHQGSQLKSVAGLCWKGGHRTESVPYVHLLPHKTSPNSQAAPMQMLGRPEETEAQAAHVFARPWGCVEAMPRAMQIKVKNLTPFHLTSIARS